MKAVFQEIPFSDPARAEAILDGVLTPERPGLCENLGKFLAECHDPNTALVRLERFLAESDDADGIRDLMAAEPRFAKLVMTIFGQSHFLTDIVCRHPAYMMWLWNDAELGEARSCGAMLAELREGMAGCADFDACRQWLRRFKQREILRIGARDLYAHGAIPSVTLDLSNLADAALQASLECAHGHIAPRYGEPREQGPGGDKPAAFVILAMGKLGGRELNFSSDIDLLFVFSDDGETTGGGSGSVSNTEYFQKLGEFTIKAMSDVTAEGNVFRVDMRLRPHGRSGPLSVSLEGALHYYQHQGQAWERQALIKARPAAGDAGLGAAFIEETRPFAFPRYFDDETLEEIRNVKRQMEEQVHGQGRTETEVKLGRGGIRDIEFTVQMLQLLNGGRIPALRTPNTLEAIEQLGRHDVLRPFEADTLARNYAFLRKVEHRLQIEGSKQVHALPAKPGDLGAFARRLGYVSGESFMAEYRERAKQTRDVLEQFLAAKGSGNLWVLDLLNGRSEAEKGLERLKAMGFGDPPKARQELLHLYQGPRENPHSLHTRQAFADAAPTLLQALAACPNPDNGLLRLSQLLANIKAPNAIYDLLKNSERLCEYLAILLSNSQYLTEILIRDPGLFDQFGYAGALDQPASRGGLEAQLSNLLSAYEPEAAPYRLRDGEMLRIGMRDLFMGLGVTEVCGELTLLAEVILAHVLGQAESAVGERFGAAGGGFAVLGLGKLGGHELGYGSDLDVIFVYDGAKTIPGGVSPGEYFAAVASQLGRLLKEPTRHGSLYEIDARLRPEGRRGPLAVSDSRFEQYYREEAQGWERLALMKARPVAGDPEFSARMGEWAQDLAFGQHCDGDFIEHIETMRGKIAESAPPRDLKKAEGGIVEIEFAVRLLQLRYHHEAPDLRRADVTGAIAALRDRGFLDDEGANTLDETYRLYRRIENRIRMMQGRPGSALPEDPAEQESLAQRLGLEGDLAGTVAEAQARVHGTYQTIIGTLSR